MPSTVRVIALGGLLCVFAVAAPSAALAKQKDGARSFRAVFSGGTSFQSDATGALGGTSDGAIRGKPFGKGAYHLETTARARAGGGWTVEGRFEVTAADGDKLRGTVEGAVSPEGDRWSVRFRDLITGGTGRFAGAKGRVQCRGTTRIASFDAATGVIRMSDEGTWKGRIRY